MFFKSKANVSQESVLKILSQVQDPDLHRDIVALGFVQNLEISPAGDVRFKLVLTTPACPVKEQLQQECEQRLKGLSGVRSVAIELASEVRPAQPAPSGQQNQRLQIPGVRQMIAVASGKGGVGKSSVTLNLAIALAAEGAKVGVLDADVYGPSIPHMLGISSRPAVQGDTVLPVESPYGVKAISMGFFVPQDQAIVWRGPMVHSALTQFMNQVQWGDLDYLLIDMPPGTGDAQLTMSQMAPLTGAVIVTTPQDISLLDARRGLKMFQQVGVPILGVIENMAGFVCSHCHQTSDIFLKGGGAKIAQEMGTQLLGSIPLDPAVCSGADQGRPVVLAAPESPAARAFRTLAQKVASSLSIAQFQNKGFQPLEMTWRS